MRIGYSFIYLTAFEYGGMTKISARIANALAFGKVQGNLTSPATSMWPSSIVSIQIQRQKTTQEK